MLVALIAPPWVPVPPPAYGGTEEVVDALARGLAERGHDVVLVAHPDSTCPVERRAGVAPPADIAMGTALVECAHVLDAYERLPAVDVVHDHTLLGPLFGRAPRGAASVVTNHGPFDARTRRVFRDIAPRAAIVSISHAQAANADDVPVDAVIHHGFDVARVPVGDGNGGYLLFLGRMAAEKGVHRAAALARAAGVPLLIAAKMREAAEHRYFEQEVRPLLGPRIEYVGEVGRDEKLALLGGALALINPIQWCEPFGMVMVESLACGTPVVAPPIGSVPEIVRHGVTGFVCPDDDAFRRALSRLDGISRDACRDDVRRRFSVERMVAGHLALYERVIDPVRGLRRHRPRAHARPGRATTDAG